MIFLLYILSQKGNCFPAVAFCGGASSGRVLQGVMVPNPPDSEKI